MGCQHSSVLLLVSHANHEVFLYYTCKSKAWRLTELINQWQNHDPVLGLSFCAFYSVPKVTTSKTKTLTMSLIFPLRKSQLPATFQWCFGFFYYQGHSIAGDNMFLIIITQSRLVCP